MFRPSSSFEKLLDKATTNLKLEPDWPLIIQICDMIRQGDVQPKIALQSIRKKMTHTNPHVVMFALNVLESCVKNCGAPVHDEMGTKTYMEGLKELIKTTPHENVKNKLLELIQAWAHAFRNSAKYRAVQDTVNILKSEGYKFPTLKESDAMFSADTAPEWADGEVCHRCRVQFSVLQRKHHCRACGQVFCAQCTSKMSTIPKFGIEKEVRVCDSCFDKVNKPTAATAAKSDDLPIEYLTSSLAQQNQAPPPRKTEAELKEEEDLQLAIALSQSEAEVKSHQRSRSAPITSNVTQSYSPPPKFSLSTSPDQSNPELERYLNRHFWQQQSDFSNASAPAPQQQASKQQTLPLQGMLAQNGFEDEEMEGFINTLRSNVEIFVNRMKSNSSRGRPISNDTSVQTLFLNITAMHSKLLRYIQQQDDMRVHYEGLQDKLTQVKDARAALDALREEHREKLRREAELAEKQRQMQMAQKLDIMRKKKQEYLAYQRQLALQRIQDQEREMQLRQEQQKQQYMMGSYGSMPYMPQGGYGNDGMVPGRFPGSPQQHTFPPYNPSSVPVDQLMVQAHMMNMSGGPMVVGGEQGMMVSGGPRPMMGGPNIGIPMAPPQGPHHPQGGHPMGQNPGMPPPHMGPGVQPPSQPGPQMNQQGRPIAPPMGPSPQHSAPHMGPMPSQPGAPPMGPQPGAPPMGVQPGAPPMVPPSLQGLPTNMGMPPQQMGPPSHMMPPQGFPPHQQEPIKREEDEKTAELISFD